MITLMNSPVELQAATVWVEKKVLNQAQVFSLNNTCQTITVEKEHIANVCQ